MKRLILPLVLAAAFASPAAALEPLAAERHINDSLISARVADRIRKTCPSIDGRVIYAFSQARALKSYARAKGYSEAQIDAFLDSKDERARIYAVAETYLAQQGATKKDPESFCAVGRKEIAARSLIGSLLVAR